MNRFWTQINRKINRDRWNKRVMVEYDIIQDEAKRKDTQTELGIKQEDRKTNTWVEYDIILARNAQMPEKTEIKSKK